MEKLKELYRSFAKRHLGPRPEDIETMLETIGCSSLDELIDQTIPASIRIESGLDLGEAISEAEVLARAEALGSENSVFRSFIGMGYYDCVTPAAILRNIFENPGWYTQYTPYQAEISQGRLEALLNFQTMVSDLTGLELANASLLDEGTAAAEAMALCYSARGKEGKSRFFVSTLCHPQTIDVLKTRADRVGIELVLGEDPSPEVDEAFFGALLQYPASDGLLFDPAAAVESIHNRDALVVCATDLMALTLLTPPGEWGADVAVGNSQRFGVPLGFGGPHAAFLATRDEYKRLIPGRIVGVSKDRNGRPAYRLALQTREQHIRRDKATSNICTAQVLLAIMAGMYAVYHGPEGIIEIARRIHERTLELARSLAAAGIAVRHRIFFDTLRVEVEDPGLIRRRSREEGFNFRHFPDGSIGISLDETTGRVEIGRILEIVTGAPAPDRDSGAPNDERDFGIPRPLERRSGFLTHPVFNSYRSETELLRYIHRLQARDLSLTRSMIPLGSCTMKLNAAVEMMPISWSRWNRIHPFAPLDQARGYLRLFDELEAALCEVTGLARASLQPNSGAQGEYAGLLAIVKYLEATGNAQRDVCLIPSSAHGTNPASAVMAGLKVVTVKCAENGDIDLSDLQQKLEKYGDRLAALMVTYPSTHGVFEESIREICRLIHDNGGQVYMDGANMNAMVGLCRPGDIGVDVCHLNLHKTFCIPHGGGGPGVGPIVAASHLAPFIPGHFHLPGAEELAGPVASAPWGSASILPISWAYIQLMGGEGLTLATRVAILNANYIAVRLDSYYPVLYKGRQGRVAHECILDCRGFKKKAGISVADIAKRLMDYGFHAPTVSWPVVETMMVEPTESESLEELDRFCEAMIAIRKEIEEVELGIADGDDNVLRNAPHTADMVTSDDWTHPYSRSKAAYPVESLRASKFWTPSARIDDTWGDRHLFCSCVPVEGLEGMESS